MLISDAVDRLRRRPFNEAVLDTDRPMHSQAPQLAGKVVEEADALVEQIDRTG